MNKQIDKRRIRNEKKRKRRIRNERKGGKTKKDKK